MTVRESMNLVKFTFNVKLLKRRKNTSIPVKENTYGYFRSKDEKKQNTHNNSHSSLRRHIK